ncbi:MAG TPA: hypothetical protein VIK95_02175 [Egibacteraceae bacterium]
MDRSELDALLRERALAWDAWEEALQQLISTTDPESRPIAIARYREARAKFYEVHESLEAHLISLLRNLT